MFGQVVAVWAGHDRICVVDWQVPAVRVYDFDGRHIRDLGRRGQRPGEFMSPVECLCGRGADRRTYLAVGRLAGSMRVDADTENGRMGVADDSSLGGP
jgi:hypothetical protein